MASSLWRAMEEIFDIPQISTNCVCSTSTMDKLTKLQELLDDLRESDPEAHRLLLSELAEHLGYGDMIDVMDDVIERHLRKH